MDLKLSAGICLFIICQVVSTSLDSITDDTDFPRPVEFSIPNVLIELSAHSISDYLPRDREIII